MRKVDPFELGYDGFKFWRRHEFGKRLIRRFMPRLAKRLEPKWAQRAARRAQRQRQPDEAAGEFFQTGEDMTMDSIKGAFQSKLVWLGLVQIGYSLFETWANGGLNAEAVSTAISGALTIIFRAVTTESLAAKAAKK